MINVIKIKISNGSLYFISFIEICSSFTLLSIMENLHYLGENED